MTLLAARPVERRAMGLRRVRVRIVAGAAPEAVPAGPLAGALLQLFEMAVGVQEGGAGAGPDEVARVIRKQLPGPVVFSFRAWARNPGGAGQVALGANAIPPRRVQLRGIDNSVRRFLISRSHPRHMLFPRSVASLATNAAFEKRRRRETVLRAGDGLNPARVTYEASSPHGPREMDERVLLVARRNIPLARKRIIR